MGDPFQLALAGASDALAALIDRRDVGVDQPKVGGLYNGFTLLHCAAAKGHIPLAHMLLAKGASTAKRNPKGLTAGQLAAEKGHHALASILNGGAPRHFGGAVPNFGSASGKIAGAPQGGHAPFQSTTRLDADGFVISEGVFIVGALALANRWRPVHSERLTW